MSLLKILLFIVKYKFSFFKLKKVNIWFIVKNIILLFVVILLSTFIIKIYNLASTNDFYISTSRINYILTYLITFISVLKDFFPVYKPKTKLINHIYPISVAEKIIIELFYDIFSEYYVFVLLFISVITFYSPFFLFIQAIELFLLIFISLFINNTIRVILEFTLRNKIIVISLFLLLITSLFFLIIFPISLIVTLVFISVLLLLFTFNYYFVEKNIHLENSIPLFNKVIIEVDNKFLSLIFNNNRVKGNLIILLLIKTCVLLFVGFTHFLYPNEKLDVKFAYPAICLFFGPYMISSILNNIFGIYRNLWLQIENNSQYNNSFFKIYSKIALQLILFDLFFSFLYVLLTPDREEITFLCLFYLFYSFVVFTIGVISSIYFAKHKEGVFQVGSLSSNFMGFIHAGLIWVCTLPLITKWFYLLYIIIGLSLLFILNDCIRAYDQKRFVIYKKLFRSR